MKVTSNRVGGWGPWRVGVFRETEKVNNNRLHIKWINNINNKHRREEGVLFSKSNISLSIETKQLST